MNQQALSFIPIKETIDVPYLPSESKSFLSFDGIHSTLHHLNYELPIKNHNLVQFNGEKTLVPVDHLLTKQEYEGFRDNVEKGNPFTQTLSDQSINTLFSIIARYKSGQLDSVVSPIKVLKKQFAGDNREFEKNLSFVSDEDFTNIFLSTLQEQEKQKKKNDSKNQQMEYER